MRYKSKNPGCTCECYQKPMSKYEHGDYMPLCDREFVTTRRDGYFIMTAMIVVMVGAWGVLLARHYWGIGLGCQ